MASRALVAASGKDNKEKCPQKSGFFLLFHSPWYYTHRSCQEFVIGQHI